jgi:hypothetical protein
MMTAIRGACAADLSAHTDTTPWSNRPRRSEDGDSSSSPDGSSPSLKSTSPALSKFKGELFGLGATTLEYKGKGEP